MFEVNVSPDMGMYHLLRSQGYEQAYAIAEFIDNALQAHFSHAEETGTSTGTLEISLHVYSNDFTGDSKKRNSIVVTDRGPGITKARLAEAMKPAKTAPHKGLSEFGIGMKAAAVWFSDKWSLCTIPAGSTHKYDLTFNLPMLLDAGSDKVSVQEHVRAKADHTGTTITLHSLRRPIDKDRYDVICRDLRDLYQRFTSGALPRLKLTSYYNDTPTELDYDGGNWPVLVAPKHRAVGKQLYSIGKDREWSVSVSMVFEGIRIEGLVYLRKVGSYVDNPGIVMFRGDRVIVGTTRNPNLPTILFRTSNKYARQRVYGRLFADGLPVTYTKDAFEIDEKAFWEQLRAVDGMEDLLAQAESYRKDGAIAVKKESNIPNGKAKQKGAVANNNQATKPQDKPRPAPKNPSPKDPPPPLVALLTELRPKTKLLALQAMMDEAIYQHHFRREVAAAMCLRSVLELAVLHRFEQDFSAHYPNVSHMGIKNVLSYLNKHLLDFFDKKRDHSVIKCIQNTTNGTQADIVLLNNAAHGSFQPTLRELNLFVCNLESLLRWALR